MLLDAPTPREDNKCKTTDAYLATLNVHTFVKVQFIQSTSSLIHI